MNLPEKFLSLLNIGKRSGKGDYKSYYTLQKIYMYIVSFLFKENEIVHWVSFSIFQKTNLYNNILIAIYSDLIVNY